MKSVLLIGLGIFGQTLGEKLMAMDNEVLAVDRDEDKVNAVAKKYTNAIIANCMNVESLRSLDIPSFDACVVAISDDFQSSLEITSNLKDLGAKFIISKASTEIQRKFLYRVGADEVIYPNRDLAEKLAVKINSKRVYNYIELDSEHAIFEIAVPPMWLNKTIVEVNPRKKYSINVLTIKKGEQIFPNPGPDYMFEDGDHMLVFGNTERILAFTNKGK